MLTGVDLGGGPSGFVLLRELRHRDEHRPVIMILEEHEIDDVLAAFRLGAVDVLLEPLRPSELLCIVDRVCGVAANEAAERAGLDTLGSGAFVKPVSDDLPGIDELSKETGQLDGEGEA